VCLSKEVKFYVENFCVDGIYVSSRTFGFFFCSNNLSKDERFPLGSCVTFEGSEKSVDVELGKIKD
jgi:hypothetical protein